MSNSIKIAIDVMGSDNGPEAIISGAALSKERNPKSEYIFFGDQKLISAIPYVDEKLKKLLGKHDGVTYFSLQKLMNKHFIKYGSSNETEKSLI